MTKRMKDSKRGFSSEKLQQIVNDVKEAMPRVIEDIRHYESTNSGRAMALSELSIALAKVGLIQDAKVIADEALRAANNEERERLRLGAICEYVCPALVKVGEFEKALRRAQGVKEEEPLEQLATFTRKLTETNDSENALRITNQFLVEEPYRSRGLSYICESLAKAGRVTEALNMVKEITEAYSLKRLCQILVKVGEVDEALSIAKSINNSPRLEALMSVAEGYAERGQIQKAKACIDEILNKVDETDRPRALHWKARIAARVGEIQEAQEIARELCEERRVRSWCYFTLQDICEALATTQKVDEALETANRIDDENSREAALSRISRALVEIGQVEKAIDIAKEISDVDERAFTIFQVSKTLAEKGLFGKVMIELLPLMTPYYVAKTLDFIVDLYIQNGRFDEATSLAKKVGSPYARIKYLAKIYSMARKVR